jgi:HEAT repeat protein
MNNEKPGNPWILLAILCFVSFVTGHSTVNATQQDDSSTTEDLKPTRSNFPMEDLHEFISLDLSRPVSRGSIEQAGGSIRTLHGRLVDHQENPIVDAVVVLVERIGYHDKLYDENFDRTDDQGRFLVQGHEDLVSLVFQKGKKLTWRVSIPPFDRERLDPEFQLVKWPAPSKCRLRPDETFNAKENQEFVLATTEYWTGMSPLTLKANLENGVVVFEDLLPSKYAVLTNWRQQRVQIGVIEIAAGENKELELENSGRVANVTTCWKNAKAAHIYTAKTKYESVVQQVDVAYPKDGVFKTRKLPPGEYTVRIQIPLPERARPLAIEDGRLPRGGNFQPGNSTDIVRTLTLVEGQGEQSVSFEEADGAIARLHQIFESKPTGSWSHLDVQRSQIVAMKENEQIVDELIRVVGDYGAPATWRYISIDCLGCMTEKEKVTEFLISKLGEPDTYPTSFIYAFNHCSLDAAERAMPKLNELTRSPVKQTRGATYNTLAHMGAKHKSLLEEIIPIMLNGLDDSNIQTQIGAISNLGNWKAEEALPRLKELKKHAPSQSVKVCAAAAIWKINGDAEQAIKTMIKALYSNDMDGKEIAASTLAQFPELPNLAIKALKSTADYEPSPPIDADSMQVKSLRSAAKRTLDAINARTKSTDE